MEREYCSESVNVIAECVTWLGVGGGAVAVVLAAPAAAILFLGVSLVGLGMGATGQPVCTDCVPRDFSHVE